MNETITTLLITTASSALTGLAAWIASGRKRLVELQEREMVIRQKDAEIKKMRDESATRIMKQYQDALDDLQKRYEERFEYLKKEYKIRHEDVKKDYERKYQQLVLDKDNAIAHLQSEIEKLKRNLDLWKNKYRTLKKEIEK